MEGNTEGKNDPRVISDMIARKKYENSSAGVTERYMNDIRSYLYSKMNCCTNCSCISTDILDEIAVYCANRMTVSMTDALYERDRAWKKIMEKQERAVRIMHMQEINRKRKENLNETRGIN